MYCVKNVTSIFLYLFDCADLSERRVDLWCALLVPQADRVHQPEEVVPLRPRNGLLAQQLEDGWPHRRPLVLEGQLALVLQHRGKGEGGSGTD